VKKIQEIRGNYSEGDNVSFKVMLGDKRKRMVQGVITSKYRDFMNVRTAGGYIESIAYRDLLTKRTKEVDRGVASNWLSAGLGK